MIRSPGTSRARPAFVIASALVLAGLAAAAFWPVNTRAGVNYVVTERQIPLSRKAWEFIERDRHTRRLAKAVFHGASTDEERLFTALRWTSANVRPHPANAPVLDDHVWSIIRRGYGSNDQMADVFTTLLTYGGVPAYWMLIGPGRPDYPISFVLVDGRWRVVDVEREIVFQNRAGEPAAARELIEDPSLVRLAAAERVSDPEAYMRWVEQLPPVRRPRWLRAEMQMPVKRAAFELRKAFGTADGRSGTAPVRDQ
jgi:hypothetical protein